MSSKSPRIKLGVFNMTICFDRSKGHSPLSIQYHQSPPKTQQIPSLIPRYSSQRRKFSSPNNDGRMSPYQSYRNNKNQSIRYFRGQDEINKNNQQKIAGFHAINKTVKLQIKEKSEEGEHTYTPKTSINDNHLKMVYNKKHLRNSIDLQQKVIKNHEKLILNFKTNPQENLKTIFTVRAVQTSQRSRLKIQKQSYNERQKRAGRKCFAVCDLKARESQVRPLKQGEIKRIRPWSTSKNWESKIGMYQSEILDNQDSLQTPIK